MAQQMTGARRLLECLQEEGVRLVFGYPGGAALPLYDALVDVPGLRHILVRHEQGAAHAADAYARASGGVGVCLATSGPGATNLVTGLAAAFADSIPVVAVTGQVPSSLLGSDAFQEVDAVGITLPVTKHGFLVRRAEEIPAVLHRAFALAREGRPGPVLIDLPKDLASSRREYAPCGRRSPPVRPPLTGDLEAAGELLRASSRPVLYVGGGAARSGAAPLVRRFARRHRIPVTTTLMALGVHPTDDPLFLGMPGMHGTRRANLALKDADLLVAVGARFDDRVTGKASGFSSCSKRIHLDVDPCEPGKLCRADVRLVGDAHDGMEALLGLEGGPDTAAWLGALERHPRVPPLALAGAAPDAVVSPARVFEVLNRLLPEDALVATDVGQHQMWAAQHLRFRTPGAFLTSGGLGAMGFGIPAALGAKLACPGRTVVSIVGDGGFQMTCQELSTMRRYGVGAVVVLMDNRSLGMVRQWQQMFHGERFSQVDLSDNPDFVKLSEAMGVPALKVEGDQDLEAGLARALSDGGPFVVHVAIHARSNVFPIVPPGEPAHVMLDRAGVPCPG